MLRVRIIPDLIPDTQHGVTPARVPDRLPHMSGLPEDVDLPDMTAAEPLSRALWVHAGLPAPGSALCNGLGRCGACRVRLVGEAVPAPLTVEREVLGEQVEDGWRLACRRTVGDVAETTVELHVVSAAVAEAPEISTETSPEAVGVPVPDTARPTPRCSADRQEAVLAVDLGTTSIHWQALTQDGQVQAAGQALNPQNGAGADVVSRLAVAATPDGRHSLSRVVRAHLRRILTDVTTQHPHLAVRELCVAANTAMSAILLDLPVAGLLAAPYRVPYAGGQMHVLPDLPPLWMPPQPAPFVGGDIAAGMLWVREQQADAFPLLFIDMGTNGECVLATDRNTVRMTSVPLGPALEGIGLACGGLADVGAATAFTLGPSGLTATVMGGGSPRVISGTGVLSLLDLLVRHGLLRSDGTPNPGPHAMPLAARLARSITRGGGDSGGAGGDPVWRLPLPGGLWLDGRDVEAVLGVRAACAVAVDRLLAAADMSPDAVRTVFLAGSLGEHAPLEALGRLGFVPRALIARTRAVGNAALAGAALLARCPTLRNELVAWCARWQLVDVTADPVFMSRFAAAMRLAD